jgi:hypothetical protein
VRDCDGLLRLAMLEAESPPRLAFRGETDRALNPCNRRRAQMYRPNWSCHHNACFGGRRHYARSGMRASPRAALDRVR